MRKKRFTFDEEMLELLEGLPPEEFKSALIHITSVVFEKDSPSTTTSTPEVVSTVLKKIKRRSQISNSKNKNVESKHSQKRNVESKHVESKHSSKKQANIGLAEENVESKHCDVESKHLLSETMETNGVDSAMLKVNISENVESKHSSRTYARAVNDINNININYINIILFNLFINLIQSLNECARARTREEDVESKQSVESKQTSSLTPEQLQKRREVFSKLNPTVEQVQAYAASKHYKYLDCSQFHKYYSHLGWHTKTGSIVYDWKQKVDEWEQREKDRALSKQSVNGNSYVPGAGYNTAWSRENPVFQSQKNFVRKNVFTAEDLIAGRSPYKQQAN